MMAAPFILSTSVASKASMTRLGHDGGDFLLKTRAERLCKLIRAGDPSTFKLFSPRILAACWYPRGPNTTAAAMDTYDEVVQFARDCMHHARSATTKQVAAELERIAREYQATAAKLAGGKMPDIGADPEGTAPASP